MPEHEQQQLRNGAAVTVDVPVLQNIVDKTLRPGAAGVPRRPGMWGTRSSKTTSCIRPSSRPAGGSTMSWSRVPTGVKKCCAATA